MDKQNFITYLMDVIENEENSITPFNTDEENNLTQCFVGTLNEILEKAKTINLNK